MGLGTFGGSGSYCSTSSPIVALESISNLMVIARINVSAMRAMGGGSSIGVCQQDDNSNPVTSYSWHLQIDAASGSPPASFRFRLIDFNQGDIDTGFIAAANWPTTGYIVAVLWINQSTTTRGFAIFDGTGTGTLLDGQAQGSSIFYGTKSYNGAITHTSGDGYFRVNYASGGAANQTIDGVAVFSQLRAWPYDSTPSPTETGLVCGVEFTDGTGSITTVADMKAGNSSYAVTGTLTEATGGSWPAPGSTPMTVVASPSTLQINLPAGTTATSALTTKDQNGVVMPSRTYSIGTGPNAAVATASITGTTLTVTAVAQGSTSLTVQDTATGGGGATLATVNIIVGTTYDWSYPGIATGATGAASELVTEASAGTGSLTIARHGTGASCTVTLTFTTGGGGSANEPSGMTVGINTGDLTIAPPTTASNWNVGTALVTQFQMFSPATPNSVGEVATNLKLCPDGPGYDIWYPTSLVDGNSPVRFGASLVQPIAAPAGYLYGSLLYRLGGAAASWVYHPVGNKLLFPRQPANATGGNNENHFFSNTTNNGSGSSKAYATFGAQWASSLGGTPPTGGVNTLYPSPQPGFSNEPLGQFSVNGSFQKWEWLWTPESALGAANGVIDMWLAGSHACHQTGVQFTVSGDVAKGVVFYMFDPTWGGAGPSPSQLQAMSFNQLYASTK